MASTNMVEATDTYVRVACPACATHRVVQNDDYSSRLRSGIPLIRCSVCRRWLPLPDRRFNALPAPVERRSHTL